MIAAGADARLGAHRLSEPAARAIRARYRVENEDFAVLLIGKDGGVKQTSRSVPDLDQMFALIDGMPMRQMEMRARDQACD